MSRTSYYNSMIFYASSNADTTKTPLLNICYYPCNAMASFTFQSLGGSMLQFTNTSTSNMGLSSSWVFYNQSGAFATSTAANPQITFMGQPPYSASLFIQDSLHTSCFDSIVQTVTFNPNTTCIILQQGATKAVGADLEDFSPTTNFDFTTFPEFVCSHWTHLGTPTENRSLLKYDFSSIPAGSVVVSAFLSLYADSTSILDNLGQPTYGSQNASN